MPASPFHFAITPWIVRDTSAGRNVLKTLCPELISNYVDDYFYVVILYFSYKSLMRLRIKTGVGDIPFGNTTPGLYLKFNRYPREK